MQDIAIPKRFAACLLAALVVAACGTGAEPDVGAAAAAPARPTEAAAAATAAAPTPPPAPSAPTFVDFTWRAEVGSDVPLGTKYTFQRDGVLVVTGRDATPLRGTWRLDDGMLWMAEDGVPARTDVFTQDADRLHLRRHDPDGRVELVLARVR